MANENSVVCVSYHSIPGAISVGWLASINLSGGMPFAYIPKSLSHALGLLVNML